MMFDYESLGSCEYEVLDNHNNSFGCGQPASYKVWWDDINKGIIVCKEHFEYIKKCEDDNV